MLNEGYQARKHKIGWRGGRERRGPKDAKDMLRVGQKYMPTRDPRKNQQTTKGRGLSLTSPKQQGIRKYLQPYDVPKSQSRHSACKTGHSPIQPSPMPHERRYNPYQCSLMESFKPTPKVRRGKVCLRARIVEPSDGDNAKQILAIDLRDKLMLEDDKKKHRLQAFEDQVRIKELKQLVAKLTKENALYKERIAQLSVRLQIEQGYHNFLGFNANHPCY